MTLLRHFIRVVIGAVFIWAALGKIANPVEFHAALLAYRLPLPSPALQLTAIILPWIELIVGFLLVLGSSRTRAALVLAAALFALFALATGQAWLRGLTISCGCLDLRFLGVPPGTFLETAWFACLRAGLLLTASLWLLRNQETSKSGVDT